MQKVWTAGCVYFALVFGVAFAVGAFRVTVVAPRIGDFAAVAVEVPVILATAWIVAGRVLARWPLRVSSRLAMGAIAFALLMLAEFALATLAFGQSGADFAARFATPPGLAGLSGQMGFAILPALRQLRG